MSALDNDEERATFTDIYESLKYTCIHVALKITKNQAMAEDAVHNAFVSLILHKEKYLEMKRCKLKSLIVIIVKNKAIDLLRGEKYKIDMPIENLHSIEVMDNFCISEYVTSGESYRWLVDCISRLPEQYRVVLQLRYIHEFRNNEIAEKLGETQQIIAMKLYRAKKILKKLLLKEGEYFG
jgi:RNA polymerase sigma-70 factor (ECF subfamily)